MNAERRPLGAARQSGDDVLIVSYETNMRRRRERRRASVALSEMLLGHPVRPHIDETYPQLKFVPSEAVAA